MNEKRRVPFITWSLLSYIPGQWYNGKVGLMIAAPPPPLDSRTIYYLFSLGRQSLMMVWEEGVDGVRAISQWQLFMLCGAVVCNFVWYTHKEATLKGEAAAIAFYSFHLASKQSQNSAARTMLKLSPVSRTRDYKLAFVSRPPRTSAFITQEFFPKPCLGIAAIAPYDTSKMSLLLS